MDSIIIWAKENYNIIVFVVGIIGVIISIISLAVAINEKKRKGMK